MRWFRNLKIGVKLSLGYAVMVLLMVILAYEGYLGIRSINERLTNVLEVRLHVTGFLLNADRDLQQMLVAERSLMFAEPGSPEQKQLLADYEENLQQAKERSGKAGKLLTTSRGLAFMKEFERLWTEWEPSSRSVIRLIQSGTAEDKAEALALTTGLAAKQFEAMREQIDNLQNLNDEIIETTRQEASAIYAQNRVIIMVALAVAVLIAVLLGVFLTRGITGPVREGVHLAEAIASGDLSERLELN